MNYCHWLQIYVAEHASVAEGCFNNANFIQASLYIFFVVSQRYANEFVVAWIRSVIGA